MELVLTIALIVGLVLLAIFAADRQMCLSGLETDLTKYLSGAKQVVEIADDPRVIIHYKAVVAALSVILGKYFPTKE